MLASLVAAAFGEPIPPGEPKGLSWSPRAAPHIPLIGYLFHCFMTGAWRGSV